MKRQALCSSLQALGLFRANENSIISAGEGGIGTQRHCEFEPVPNDALERYSLLRANRGDAGCRAESVDGTLPDLLATCFRIDLPSWAFGCRCTGSHPGFFCYAP